MKDNNLNVLIRLVRKSDLVKLAKIYKDIYNAEGQKWSIKTATKFLDYFYKNQKNLFFVAELNKKVVGSASGLVKVFDLGNDLTDVELFVDPKVHNKGIGKKLLTTLLKSAIKKCNVLDIQGIADNSKKFPMKWYSKIGLKKTKWIHICGNAKEILKNLKK